MYISFNPPTKAGFLLFSNIFAEFESLILKNCKFFEFSNFFIFQGQKGGEMSYRGRNQIYESVIKNMVMKSLEEQERQFEEAHSSDTDEMLLEYLKESYSL